ncbi:hypothetical protein AKJ16_DCAP22161 [Drosera capensis]
MWKMHSFRRTRHSFHKIARQSAFPHLSSAKFPATLSRTLSICRRSLRKKGRGVIESGSLGTLWISWIDLRRRESERLGFAILGRSHLGEKRSF